MLRVVEKPTKENEELRTTLACGLPRPVGGIRSRAAAASVRIAG